MLMWFIGKHIITGEVNAHNPQHHNYTIKLLSTTLSIERSSHGTVSAARLAVHQTTEQYTHQTSCHGEAGGCECASVLPASAATAAYIARRQRGRGRWQPGSSGHQGRSVGRPPTPAGSAIITYCLDESNTSSVQSVLWVGIVEETIMFNILNRYMN